VRSYKLDVESGSFSDTEELDEETELLKAEREELGKKIMGIVERDEE